MDETHVKAEAWDLMLRKVEHDLETLRMSNASISCTAEDLYASMKMWLEEARAAQRAYADHGVEAPKVPGMAVQALAGEIVAALLADEKDGGYDLTAGLFGASFSALVRRWAAAEWAARPERT